LIQRDLAVRAGVSLRSVQDWEAGIKFPTPARLQALIRAFLEAGGFAPEREASEARALWSAAEREGPRTHTPFDDDWFAGLLAAHASPLPEPAPIAFRGEHATTTAERTQDWGEAPDTTGFVGRVEELALLRRWVLEEHCRLVAVLGFGGIGKTILAARSAQQLAANFECMYWRSLRNAPPVDDWLAGAIGFLSDQRLVPPAAESERITLLLQLLRARRCLLVLDNFETVLEPVAREGRYRDGLGGYGALLRAVGQASHKSCLLVTSREAPPELAVLGDYVRQLELHGLGTAAAQVLVADKQLHGDAQAWVSLVDRYGGNGLALKIVAETVRQVFDGSVAAFLEDAIGTSGTIFGGIRQLFDVQAERLSSLERDILTRLAIEREPISLTKLASDMPSTVGRSTVVEAIQTLRRRSLVELGEGSATFTLQSMVLEYVTDRLVETAAAEIGGGESVVLVELPLIKAQAKDYVRETQERLIGIPILQRLNVQYAGAGTESRLLALLAAWRGRPAAEQGYGPGNVVNLLRLLRGDLRRLDFSRLSVRQVYLQGVNAQDASLAGAHLAEAVLDEAFAYPTTVALSANGAVLAAGTPTGEVRIWRTADRTLLIAAHGHASMVWGVALSADGRLLISGGEDGTVGLWETGSGQLLATLRGHTAGVRGVALSSDGRLGASAGWDGTARVWELESGQLLATLQGHTGAVRGVALSGNGRLVASGGADSTVRLWEARSAKLVATLRGHIGLLSGVALSADGCLVASSGADGTVRLWAAGTRQPLVTLQGDSTGAVRCVALSGDGRLVASGSNDGMVRVWETRHGQLVDTLRNHSGLVWGVALSSDGQLVASGGADGTLRLWQAGSGRPLATMQGETAGVQGVSLSGDGQLVSSGGVDGTVRLWETGSGRLLATLQGHTGVVLGVAVSGDGRLLASASSDGTVRLWEPAGRRPLQILRGHTGATWCVALSTDGRRAASGGVDGTVRLWDAVSGELTATLQGHTAVVQGVAIAGDGLQVASGGLDGTVRLWGVETGSLWATLQAHPGGVWCVAFSGDGRLVASAGADRTVRIWEARSGHLLAALQGHTGVVYGVALSNDGRLAASGGVDGTVRLWEVEKSQLLTTLQGHAGVVWGVALSADGRLLASGGDDGIVRLSETVNGTCRHRLRSDRHYQRLDITGLTGVTEAQRAALVALGAIERARASGDAPATAR
jgi:WD40 repeat protein